MPNAKEFASSPDVSFLLVGDSGTHKTYFLRTLPRPIYVFDFDKGMAVNAGEDMDYDTFKELPQGAKPKENGKDGRWEYGTSWPAFLTKLNEIGTQIDSGTCPYKSIAFDSVSMMSDALMAYILKQNNRKLMEIQDWGAYLSNMRSLFGQVTGWPLIKAFCAHVRRMENDLTRLEEKLPMVPGQFSGLISIYFDEVYFCDVKVDLATGKASYVVQTMPSNVVRQAKSRRYNVPSGTPTDYAAISKFIK